MGEDVLDKLFQSKKHLYSQHSVHPNLKLYNDILFGKKKKSEKRVQTEAFMFKININMDMKIKYNAQHCYMRNKILVTLCKS